MHRKPADVQFGRRISKTQHLPCGVTRLSLPPTVFPQPFSLQALYFSAILPDVVPDSSVGLLATFTLRG
jgi:hypothetical protein